MLHNIEIESEAITLYQAEAKFLRAYYHFDLFRHYGPIPVLTEMLAPSEYAQSRNTMTEVFTQIVTDLEEAIPILYENHAAGMVGRITQGAAWSLLGKVYLYWADMDNDDKSKFDKAASAFREVVG